MCVLAVAALMLVLLGTVVGGRARRLTDVAVDADFGGRGWVGKGFYGRAGGRVGRGGNIGHDGGDDVKVN